MDCVEPYTWKMALIPNLIWDPSKHFQFSSVASFMSLYFRVGPPYDTSASQSQTLIVRCGFNTLKLQLLLQGHPLLTSFSCVIFIKLTSLQQRQHNGNNTLTICELLAVCSVEEILAKVLDFLV